MSAVAPTPEVVAYVATQRAALVKAMERETEQTLEALKAALGGKLPERFDFSHGTLRALVRSAFFAGAAYEIARPKAGGEG